MKRITVLTLILLVSILIAGNFPVLAVKTQAITETSTVTSVTSTPSPTNNQISLSSANSEDSFWSPENIVTLVAATLAFIASIGAIWNVRFRRFAAERWWDRKADAYAKIVESLVSMTYSLERWIRYELDDEVDKDHIDLIKKDFDQGKKKIEIAAVEGDYIISQYASTSLSKLLKSLRQSNDDPILTWNLWFADLNSYYQASKTCLVFIRKEARKDLKVK